MGQFLFSYQDSSKHRPHDLGMDKSHVSFLKAVSGGRKLLQEQSISAKRKKKLFY
jgi:hypothetical protein